MNRRSHRFGLIVLVLALALPLTVGAEEEAERTKPLILLDISESILRPSKLPMEKPYKPEADKEVEAKNLLTYFLRAALKDGGFEVGSFQKTRWDKSAKVTPIDLGKVSGEEREKALQARIAELEPDFVIRGSSQASFVHVNVFHDVPVENAYHGTVKLTLLDGGGNVLANLGVDEQWGSKPASDALKSEAAMLKSLTGTESKILTRIAKFAIVDVLKQERIRAHISDEAWAKLEKGLIDEVEKHRKK